MQLIIEDPELDQKIHTVANALGKSVEETIWIALNRIDLSSSEDAEGKTGEEIDWPAVRRVLAKVDAKPMSDQRATDEILGYNEHGH